MDNYNQNNSNFNFSEKRKSSTLLIIYHNFFVYLPVAIILSLIFITYFGFVFTYVFVLLDSESYDTLTYPFYSTSSITTAKTKGIVLLTTTTFFFILLLISLLKTIIINPGYFDDPLSLEFKVVQSQSLPKQASNDPTKLPKAKKKPKAQLETNPQSQSNATSNYNLIELSECREPDTFKEQEKSKDYNSSLRQTGLLQDIDSFKKHHQKEFLNNFNEIINDYPLTFSENEKLKNLVGSFLSEEKGPSKSQFQPKLSYQRIHQHLASLPPTDQHATAGPDASHAQALTPELNERLRSIELSKAQFCGTCLRLKVERSHHCRQCGRCVLKMDHHCPWLANCVGFHNYKFFLLTDVHGLAGLVVILASFWEAVVGFNVSNTASLGLCWFVTFAYVCALSLFGFLLWLAYVNWRLAFSNQTVIENADKERFPSSKSENIYDLGFYKNFCQVFGENPLLWFLPCGVTSPGRGFVFETIYDSMK